MKRSNLELHHKLYDKSPYTKVETFRQAMDAIDNGGNRLLLEQFAILCHTCNMIITHAGQNIEKGRKALEYIKKERVLEF